MFLLFREDFSKVFASTTVYNDCRKEINGLLNRENSCHFNEIRSEYLVQMSIKFKKCQKQSLFWFSFIY